MSLLTTADLETQLNITLSDTGEVLAPIILDSVQKWAETYCGYDFESATYTDYFSEGGTRFPLSTLAPVTAGPTLTAYNSVTSAYAAYNGTVRLLSDGSVRTSDYFYEYPEGVKIVYTAGWTTDTFPA